MRSCMTSASDTVIFGNSSERRRYVHNARLPDTLLTPAMGKDKGAFQCADGLARRARRCAFIVADTCASGVNWRNDCVITGC